MCFPCQESRGFSIFLFFFFCTKTPQKAFSVMLNLRFPHIIHAAKQCHLIIECHLLCYKWRAVSDNIMYLLLVVEFGLKRRTTIYLLKGKKVIHEAVILDFSWKTQLCSFCSLSATLRISVTLSQHIHTWKRSSTATLSSLRGVAGG